MSTVTVNKSHSTINVGSNASYIVNGSDDTILVGLESTVTANGSALSVQVTGAGSIVTIGGNGVGASNTNDNVVLFKGTGTLHELANARVDVTANLGLLTMAGNDALGVYGSGDSVTAGGVGDAIWIGQNGFDVTGAALDFVSGLTHGSIFVLQGSSLETSGSYYAVTLTAQDLLLANGLGVHVTVTAPGDSVFIGGNGSGASNTDEDVVTFQAAGTIDLVANSRVDTTGNLVTATLSGADTFGLYGAGDSVTADGTGDAIWIGQNGFEVTGAALDFVSGLTRGSIFVLQGSSLETSGSYYAVTLTAQDLLLAGGLGVHVTVTAAGDIVSIGGDGAGASNTDEDIVLFQAAGTIELVANSRVDTTGNQVTATLAGGDTFGLYGSGETVTANGTGDAIWMGQNGVLASAAAIDAVHGLTDGSIYELQGSSVAVDGTNYQVDMTGDDWLSLSGAGAAVSVVSGSNNLLLANTSSVVAGFATSFNLFGDNNTVNAAGGGKVEILGGGNHVSVGQGETVLISQDHDPNVGVNVLDWGSAPIAPITVDGYTLASLFGSSAIIDLVGSGINVTVTGSNDSVSSSGDYSGDAIAIGGNGSTFGAAGQDKATLNAFDHVTLLANSNVAVNTVSGVTSSEDSVQMAAHDSLSIGAGVNVVVALGLGDDYLAGFGPTDALNLAAHFSSVNDLLAHTGLNHLNQTTIQLDTNSDTLSLDISKTTLATYANEGLVKFS